MGHGSPGRVRGALARQVIDLRPLSVAPYRRLIGGQACAYIGSMLTLVAVPVQLYSWTRSSFYVGLMGAAGLIPIVVFGLYGGAIADAMDRRRVLLTASFLNWSVTLGLLAQTLLDLRNVWLVLALVALQSGAFAITASVRYAIVPRLVGDDLLASANALAFMTNNVGRVGGPLLAGLLVGLQHGFAYAYALDAVLFTAALYAAVRLPAIPVSGAVARANVRVVLAGLSYIRHSPVLAMTFIVDLIAMVIALPRAVFPAIGEERFDGSVGPLYAAVAIGAVAAGLSSGWVGRVRRQGRALAVAVMVWGLAVAAAGLADRLWLAVFLLAVGGAADFVGGVYRMTILQSYAPDEMRGRLQGVFIAVAIGGPSLGDLRAGVMATVTSPTVSWVAGGVACFVAVFVVSRAVGPFWRYERT